MTQTEFVNRFLATFTSNIPLKVLKKARIGSRRNDFLWNLFGAELIPCFEGDAARKEYDKVDKTGAEEIQYSGWNKACKDDSETSNLEDSLTSAKEIDESGLYEFYVIGKDFEWCYVITHELDLCGPYFCYKPL